MRSLCSRLVLAAAVVSAVALLGCPTLDAAGSLHPRILALHSYHPGYPWTASVQQGLAETLAQRLPEAELLVEYMDTKRHDPDVSSPLLAELYAARYAGGRRPDIVVTSDNNAFEFMRAYGAELFPGAPLVFCGLNGFDEGMLEGAPEAAGVVENVDVGATIDVLLRLMPEVSTLAVVADETPTGRLNLEQFLAAAPRFADRLDYQVINAPPPAELARRLAALPEHAAVLYLSYLRDREGHALDLAKSLELVVGSSPAPVFGLWDFLIGSGVAGGVVVDGLGQGRAAGELAARLASGETPAGIGVRLASPNTPIFDYRVLERFGLKTAALPPGSRIVNRPVSLLDRHKAAIGTTAAVLAALVAATGYLSVCVSRRRRAEQRLASKLAFVNGLFDAIPNPLFVKDAALRYTDCNRPFEERTGISRAELVGKTVFDLYPPQVAGPIHAAERELLASGNAKVETVTVPGLKTDEPTTLLVCKAVFRDARGRPEGLVSVVTDVTELERVQQRLAQSEQRYRLLAEHVDDVIWTLDENHRFTYVSPSVQKLRGYTPEEVMARPMEDSLTPESLQRVREASAEREHAPEAAQIPLRLELEQPRKDGSTVWTECVTVPLKDDDGRSRGVLGVTRDISERKRAEERLRRASKLTTAIISAAPLPVFGLDPEGRVAFCWNGAAERMLGLSAEEAMGRDMPCAPPQTGPGFGAVLPEIMDGSFDQGRVIPGCRADGSAVEFALYASVLQDDAGLPHGCINVLVDVTKERRMQRELVAAEERARSANRAKSEFLANMSHEIRTPLNGILGMTDLVLGSELDEEQRTRLQMVAQSGRSLLRLLGDILDFSKIEAGRMEVGSETFDPRALAADCLALFRQEAETKGLDLAFNPDPALPQRLRGDAGRICQVLTNLVGNAVKFTDQGSVMVAAGPDDTAGYVRFTVRDTGCGIDKDQQQNVFELFVQADGSLTRRHGGTGLGLAISKRLVKLMGGELTLSSAPGEGAAFSFALPLQEAAEPQGGKPQPENAPKRPLRILVAEDNGVNLLFATGLLEREGHATRGVVNGRQALDALAEEPFDLVVMDIQMPIMDGMEAVRRIRSHDGTGFDPQIPVLALTAHAMKGDREAFLASGFNAYVSKPVEPEALLDTVARLSAHKGAGS